MGGRRDVEPEVSHPGRDLVLSASKMRWNIGPFGVKDLFTLVNLMGGVGAIVFTLQGNSRRPGRRCSSGSCWATRSMDRWRG